MIAAGLDAAVQQCSLGSREGHENVDFPVLRASYSTPVRLGNAVKYCAIAQTVLKLAAEPRPVVVANSLGVSVVWFKL
jgi:hypothetical protein